MHNERIHRLGLHRATAALVASSVLLLSQVPRVAAEPIEPALVPELPQVQVDASYLIPVPAIPA